MHFCKTFRGDAFLGKFCKKPTQLYIYTRTLHPQGRRKALDARDWDPVRDPRPDLTEDAIHWTRLLALAGDVSRDLVMVLNGFRCLGVRLDVRDGKARLLPGDCDEEEYSALRDQWLIPSRRVLTVLLQRVAESARETIGVR